MTTLYRPVLIESAEQAEALPAGTLAYLEHSTTAPDPLAPDASCPFLSRSTASKAATNWWLTSGNARSDAEMIGWTALVPVEAEEEWGVEMSESGAVTHVVRAITREHAERTLSHQEPGTARIVHRIRATPWESA